MEGIGFKRIIISRIAGMIPWTFRDRRFGTRSGFGGIVVRGMKFNAVSLGGMGIYGLYDIISLVLSMFIATGWNFTMNRFGTTIGHFGAKLVQWRELYIKVYTLTIRGSLIWLLFLFLSF